MRVFVGPLTARNLDKSRVSGDPIPHIKILRMILTFAWQFANNKLHISVHPYARAPPV